jgi:hypothetical protein
MSPFVITFLGMTVAVLIIAWGIFEMSKRLFTRKRSRGKNAATWVTLKPTLGRTGADRNINKGEGQEDSAQSEKPLHAQQNGHYSESKKKM